MTSSFFFTPVDLVKSYIPVRFVQVDSIVNELLELH